MSAKLFLDTNIFVYSFDSAAPKKRSKARALINGALQSGDGVISTQVVQEFLNVATRKFETPMKATDAGEYLLKVLNPLCQVYPDLGLFETALEIHTETEYSFYESLILSGAVLGKCSFLLTEDLQHGQIVRGVEIKNPFA